jgi:hypothetical protein
VDGANEWGRRRTMDSYVPSCLEPRYQRLETLGRHVLALSLGLPVVRVEEVGRLVLLASRHLSVLFVFRSSELSNIEYLHYCQMRFTE